jgi:hypothetical protein
MWYRIAITKMDPSGQLNMDFPGIGPKKFKDVKYEVKEISGGTYRVSAKLYDRLIGFLDFTAADYSDTAGILLVSLNEYPAYKGVEEWETPANPEDRTKLEMLNELKEVGYSVDDSSITRTRWGIGKGLYLEFVKFLQNYKPDIKFIKGDIHTRDAFLLRESVLGLPLEAYDPSESFGYKIDLGTSKKDREDLTRKMSNELLDARFEASTGFGDIPPDSFIVTNKLPKIPYESTKLYKSLPKIPKSIGINLFKDKE